MKDNFDLILGKIILRMSDTTNEWQGNCSFPACLNTQNGCWSCTEFLPGKEKEKKKRSVSNIFTATQKL